MAKTKSQRNRAIVDYFDQQYGRDGSTLAAWQAFSRDVGIVEGPSITQCKKRLKSVNVNIVDFVAARRSGQAVRRFGSRAALADYIRSDTNKCFPLSMAKKDSFLKTLLIELF